MHDRTRRFVCRLSFTLFCVLPTLVVAAWVAVLRSPAYVAADKTAWENRLADELGLVVTLRQVTHPSRGVTLLEGLELADPETAAQVAKVRQIEIGRRGDDLLLLASQPEFQGDQAWRLWEVLQERLLRGRGSAQRHVQLRSGEVTVHRTGDRGASTLTDVRCWLAPTAEGPQLAIEFRDVALQMAEPAQLRVTRNRRLSPPATRWELHTQSTALPCSLLADQFEILKGLGDRATFQGSIEVTQTATGWEGTLRKAVFREVDLDCLVTKHCPHKLSGWAEIGFPRATLRGGKVTEASGEVVCRGGQVSWSLLDQAAQLGLSAAPRVSNLAVNVNCGYQELRFGFTCNPQGLTIVGKCVAAAEGVVMLDEQGPLLVDKPQEVALVALIRVLSPQNGEAIPATAEASQLLHVLPIPSAHQPSPGSNGRRPYSPLRIQ